MNVRLLVLLVMIVVQAGCGRMEPVPGDTFYRLKKTDSSSIGENNNPWTENALVIERFRATGIYKDRAIALLREDGVSLTQSKYHYWNDSPELLLQERFLEHAVEQRLANSVALNSATSAEFIVSGRILRFERVTIDNEPDEVAIQLEISIRRAKATREVLFREQFNFGQVMTGDSMPDAVALFSRGIEQVFSQFITKAGGSIPR